MGVCFGQKFAFQHDLNRTHTVDCIQMLSTLEARRIALAAQGFGKAHPNRARRIAPLQSDFVNVLVPAHYLIPFFRLGSCRRESLRGRTRRAVIPVETGCGSTWRGDGA